MCERAHDSRIDDRRFGARTKGASEIDGRPVCVLGCVRLPDAAQFGAPCTRDLLNSWTCIYSVGWAQLFSGDAMVELRQTRPGSAEKVCA